MNWGNKIALAYSSFVVFMLVLVYLCYQKKDLFLVTPNYYQQELVYQDKIDQIQNVKSLTRSVNIKYTETGLLLDFPEESVGATGTINLYRPSNANRDLSTPINLNNSANQSLTTDHLIKGLWVVKLNWQKEGISYYQEQKVTL